MPINWRFTRLTTVPLWIAPNYKPGDPPILLKDTENSGVVNTFTLSVDDCATFAEELRTWMGSLEVAEQARQDESMGLYNIEYTSEADSTVFPNSQLRGK